MPQEHSTKNTASLTLTRIDNAPKVSEEIVQKFEKNIELKLPADYRQFLLDYNGAFPSPDCFIFSEAGHETASDVFCFLAIADERPWLSTEWNMETYSHRLPKSTIPIARDSSANLWLLQITESSAGGVYFWDPGSYDTFDESALENWPKVADSFQDFQNQIRSGDGIHNSGPVLTRYALVKQAGEGMAITDKGFTTRANPEFVWHCDCDADGQVSMQFIKYDIHAATTHTCGYSRLRAINGLIKEGKTRLPN